MSTSHSTSPSTSPLPDYRAQSPSVAVRFAKLKERPVVLTVENLTRRFSKPDGTETTAIENLNFVTHRREFVCILGPSGCGKSTLIRLLAGLDTPTSGRLLLDGKEVHGPGPDRGMVFQGYTLFPWKTVMQNVMFGPLMRGTDYAEARRDALQWLGLVGLSKFADAYPNQLSGGMKQRVAIARALANNPRILLMDEPFGALDAQTRAQMQKHLLQIWKNVDVTILFITHDLDEAIYLADRILVLKANPGRINELIEVPVPRPRDPSQFTSPEFLATRARLDALIHPPATSATEPTSTENLPIIRLTQAGDDVE
ncbi:ABC transporter [Nibricoccus aquaticus]|uniref:ABC transporter n=1 Tax=Nibricoccus aquaticus TaxID=2576891 RepID=A0A290QJ04_9BACT|nr:ABC transporter ATP-binding protein [Nibricoccus aquaticus]ATC65318.1 ABC transporter [Nibricoccus aquaticus]